MKKSESYYKRKITTLRNDSEFYKTQAEVNRDMRIQDVAKKERALKDIGKLTSLESISDDSKLDWIKRIVGLYSK